MQAYFEATQAMIADVGVETLAPVEEVPRQEVHVDAA